MVHSKMGRLWPVCRRKSTITVLLLAIIVLLIFTRMERIPVCHPPKTRADMMTTLPSRRNANTTSTLPPRRNADTLTIFFAAKFNEEEGVHSKGWKEKVFKTLDMGVDQQLPINLPTDLSYRDWNNLDLMKLPNFEFLPNFKNPCWRESYRPRHTCYRSISAAHEQSRYPADCLRCLPYFFMIGQPKCGTTDIYFRLNEHPDVSAPASKEMFWLEKTRFCTHCSSIDTYLDALDFHSRVIEANGKYNQSGHLYHQIITGDGTVDLMWNNAFWPLLPGNEGCAEPCVTNADIIHHLNPQAKIIVCFRDPVRRLYSDYLYEATWMQYNISSNDFHYNVLKEIDKFKTCLKTNTPRACVYNGAHENAFTTKVRLRQGLYSIHLADWLRVFPRHQIHIIKFEDYIHNIEQEMKSLFKFLDLRELSKEEMAKVPNFETANKRKTNALAVGAMRDQTKDILKQFYKEYNEQLSALLDDRRFLWD